MLKELFFRPEAREPILVADGVSLRPLRYSDYHEWRNLREANSGHLQQWEDVWDSDAVSRDAFNSRVRVAARAFAARRGAPFSVFKDGTMIGAATLHSIRYGPQCSAILGYWIGQSFLRRGHASAAVTALTDYGFDQLGLNRIEAACQPENIASAKLLKKCGFRHEGRARSYLRINNEWRDHDIYALVADAFGGADGRN